MKIPITDQFLWDVYELLKPAINVADIIFTPRTAYQLNYRLSERGKIFAMYKENMNTRDFSKLIYYLKRKNYIKVKNLEGKKAVMITKKGLNKALLSYFKKEKTSKFKKRKDGKWIMVMFDIPEKYKKSRNLLRAVLQNLGYKLFQHSVWVTQYDVSKQTEDLLQFYSLDQYIKVFLIEAI